MENSNSLVAREQSINQMANSRQEKIARYKEQKEQERKLKVLTIFLNALKLNPTTVSHCH